MNPAILVHLISALLAISLGLAILLMPKGTQPHKTFGRGWVVLMLISATSSFWIKGAGGFMFGFSWIHLLTVWTLISLSLAIYFIRRQKIGLHKAFMIGTFVGLTGAGLGALMPGRLIGNFLFS